MNSKLFCLRNKKNVTLTNNEIICDTVKLRNFITKWTEKNGWKFENFTDFIKLTGIKTPLKVSDLNESENSFKCLTGLNKELKISLVFSLGLDFKSQILICENSETKRYSINVNENNEISTPQVFLESRIVQCNGKQLSNYYSKYFCCRTLQLDDNHNLLITISEPKTSEGTSETFILRNREKIEDYLLHLNNPLVISEVYKSIINFLNFSQEDINNSDEIMFTYSKFIDEEDKEQVISKILLNKGIMQEYAIFENGETFHVYRNGDWSYLSDNNISISYVKKDAVFTFSINGAEKSIFDFEQKELMCRIKAKINELQNFVK